MSARSGALVLGVGNILWADEGFGVRCVEAFDRRFQAEAEVEAVDGGTQGLLLVSLLQRRSDLILFDAVDFGDPPGHLRLVEGREIPAAMGARAVSLHQTGMMDVLACADLLGAFPERALLIGVQPVVLEDYGGSLTEPVRARIDQALGVAASQLEAWGYTLSQRHKAQSTLFDPSLSINPYEAGRPGADEACRHGDARVLSRAS
jgi:hydrogenase maturation protease